MTSVIEKSSYKRWKDLKGIKKAIGNAEGRYADITRRIDVSVSNSLLISLELRRIFKLLQKQSILSMQRTFSYSLTEVRDTQIYQNRQIMQLQTSDRIMICISLFNSFLLAVVVIYLVYG